MFLIDKFSVVFNLIDNVNKFILFYILFFKGLRLQNCINNQKSIEFHQNFQKLFLFFERNQYTPLTPDSTPIVQFFRGLTQKLCM